MLNAWINTIIWLEIVYVIFTLLLLHDSSRFVIYDNVFVMCLTGTNWLAATFSEAFNDYLHW